MLEHANVRACECVCEWFALEHANVRAFAFAFACVCDLR